jgi:hypothetical protein
MNTVVTQTGNMVEASIIDSSDGEELAELVLLLPSKHRSVPFLNHFYVVSRVEKRKGSEKHKGLGKRLLCETITKLIDEEKLKPDDNIELDASGGSAPEGFKSTESEKSLDTFLAKYPKALSDLAHDAKREEREITVEDKGRLAEAIRQNHKLIAYYSKTYGFSVVEDSGQSARMRGTIQGILNACKSGGQRRKTRGRRKATRTRRMKNHT